MFFRKKCGPRDLCEQHFSRYNGHCPADFQTSTVRPEIRYTRFNMSENLIAAEKADYYQKTLQLERINREQTDRQVINLLSDIRNRYDIKYGGYMAKHKSKNNIERAQGDDNGAKKDAKKDVNQATDWGKSKDAVENNDDDWSGSKETEGWGTAATTTTKTDDWGAATTTTKTDDWGAATTTKTDDWGAATTTKTDDWGAATTTKTDDWGAATTKTKNSSPTTTTKTEDWGAATTTTKTKNLAATTTTDTKDWGAATTKTDDSPPTNKTEDWGTTSTDADKKNEGKKNKNKKKKQDEKTDQKKEEEKKNEVQAEVRSEVRAEVRAEKLDASNKEYTDMKNNLLTAKLDLRLLQRDKSKLTDELASTKDERDNLERKLNQASQDQDTLKMKVRGLTVDLIGANEEIHKLNERIDEIETERRNKERDVHFGENKRRSLENKYKSYQQQIAELQSELSLLKEDKEESDKKVSDLSRRNDRLEADLSHSKNLIRTLKDGCAFVESQAKNFEVRHDTVVMSKADMERELIAIKEESSRHITTINKLQKSNQQISNAFIQSVEAHEQCRKETEFLRDEYARRLEDYKLENHKLVEANSQLRKLIDYMQKKR